MLQVCCPYWAARPTQPALPALRRRDSLLPVMGQLAGCVLRLQLLAPGEAGVAGLAQAGGNFHRLVAPAMRQSCGVSGGSNHETRRLSVNTDVQWSCGFQQLLKPH